MSPIYALPFEFWLTPVFDDYSVPVQVWSLQYKKDVIGMVDHMALPVFMRSVDTPIHRARNALTEKDVELIATQAAHEAERVMLFARIDFFNLIILVNVLKILKLIAG